MIRFNVEEGNDSTIERLQKVHHLREFVMGAVIGTLQGNGFNHFLVALRSNVILIFDIRIR